MVRFFIRVVLPLVIVVAITSSVLHVSAGAAWAIVLVVGAIAAFLIVRSRQRNMVAAQIAQTERIDQMRRNLSDLEYLIANGEWQDALALVKDRADVAMARGDDAGASQALVDSRRLVSADTFPDIIRKADVLVRKLERWQRQRDKQAAAAPPS